MPVPQALQPGKETCVPYGPSIIKEHRNTMHVVELAEPGDNFLSLE